MRKVKIFSSTGFAKIDETALICYYHRCGFLNERGVKGLVDVHAHVAPGLDDGADSIEEALLMLERAYECKTEQLIVTPHFLNRAQCRFEVKKADIEKTFERLVAAKEEAGLKIELFSGAEHFGVTDIGTYIEKNEIVTLAGSRYVLVEFDFDDDIRRVGFVVSAIKNGGFVPVIAHPERYMFLQNEPFEAFGLLESGCLFQVNKGSVLGRYGIRARELSLWLLENRLVQLVGSDCHSPYQRTADMSAAHEMLTYRLGSKYVEKIFVENGLRVIHDETVTV